MLFLFSIGVTESKWMTLLNSLAEFKRLYDGGSTLLSDVLPELITTWPQVYGTMAPSVPIASDTSDAESSDSDNSPYRFDEFCQEMHEYKRDREHLRLLVQAFDRTPQPKLTPAEAYRRLVKNDVEPVPLDRLIGRTVAVAITPYPPGIPLLMAGECAGSGPEDTAVLDYLNALGDFDRKWPGFEHDVHGLDWDERSRKFRVLCVKEPCA